MKLREFADKRGLKKTEIYADVHYGFPLTRPLTEEGPSACVRKRLRCKEDSEGTVLLIVRPPRSLLSFIVVDSASRNGSGSGSGRRRASECGATRRWLSRSGSLFLPRRRLVSVFWESPSCCNAFSPHRLCQSC